MKINFLKPDNPILYKKSRKVKVKDFKQEWFIDVVEQMKSAAGVHQNMAKSKPVMVGLAAPQIGYPLRLIFVDTGADITRDKRVNKNVFMVNPRIVEKSQRVVRGQEGCYSTMADNFDVRGMVSRSISVTVEYLDLEGEKQIQKYTGFTAVIIQHEVDHLEGKIFVHRIRKEKDLHIVFESEMAKHKENYKSWKRCLHPDLYFSDIAKKNFKI